MRPSAGPPVVSAAPERAAYEARLADLVRALQRGAGYPTGFVASNADAASHALRRKRARAVARAWPALAAALGAHFVGRFDAYARAAPPPGFGGGLADGLVFAGQLARDELNPGVRAERLAARSRLTLRGGAVRARRGVFIGATVTRHPRRLIIVLRGPAGGHGTVVVPLGRGGC